MSPLVGRKASWVLMEEEGAYRSFIFWVEGVRMKVGGKEMPSPCSLKCNHNKKNSESSEMKQGNINVSVISSLNGHNNTIIYLF